MNKSDKKCTCDNKKWVDCGYRKDTGSQGLNVGVFEYRGGYIVESIHRAMWHGERLYHDKYGRKYEGFGEECNIRPEEVFPDLQSAKDYIDADFNTKEKLAEKKEKKRLEAKKKEQKDRALLAELKKKYEVNHV